MATQEPVPDAYETLLKQYHRTTYVQDAGGYLSWDQQVMMPDEGTPGRSKQLSALSAVRHDLLTDDELAEALTASENADLQPEQAAVVREVRREYDRAAKVPTDLVEEISETTSNALPTWKEAKADSDWETFAPTMEKLLDLRKQYAEHIDPDAPPYEVLFAEFEPYLDLETAERILEELRTELVPLIDDIRASDADLADPFDDTYPEDDQMALARETLDRLGYPWGRGRIDTAPHPFSLGTQFDARVTTRFDESDPMDALGSTIHEFGHATYTLGLPDDEYGSPLGKHRGLTVHESQSRLFENHVGRTRDFLGGFKPAIEEHLGESLTEQELYEAANRVYEDNVIRVEADELTYHMHIILRFEIERALLEGDLNVAEVPQVWDEKMKEYLGVVPETDAEGCLQDIHWSHGNFGYFPTYSLGSVLAAQLYAAAEKELDDLDTKIRKGDVSELKTWLRENIHQHGQRYTTDELVKRATGEKLTAAYFVEYATEKFGDLYDL